MKAKSRLLEIEVVLPVQVDRVEPRLERWLLSDLTMLVVTGGRERSALDGGEIQAMRRGGGRGRGEDRP